MKIILSLEFIFLPQNESNIFFKAGYDNIHKFSLKNYTIIMTWDYNNKDKCLFSAHFVYVYTNALNSGKKRKKIVVHTAAGFDNNVLVCLKSYIMKIVSGIFNQFFMRFFSHFVAIFSNY